LARALGSFVIQRGVRGEGPHASKRGGSGEVEHGLPPFAPALLPSKY